MRSFFFSISDIFDIVEHPIEDNTNEKCLKCLSSTINVNREMYKYFQAYNLYLLA